MSQETPTKRYRVAPATSAWLILFVFFGISLFLAVWVLQFAYRSYVDAMSTTQGAMLRGHVIAGVVMQEPRSLTSRTIERLPGALDPCPGESDVCVPLTTGDRIKTLPAAGYGPVASLVLPDTTHIQLWAQGAGSDIVYRTYQVSRWTNQRQIVNLQQNAGYARYDIAANHHYLRVEYSVTLANNVTIWMTPGGSYSINVIPDDDALDTLVQYELAVRTGSATVQRGNDMVQVAEGQIAEVTRANELLSPRTATWQLIRDPQWRNIERALSNENRYNWREFARADAPNMSASEQNGAVQVVSTCSPQSPDLCSESEQVRTLRLRRDGNQVRPFAVGIEQTLDADVSEYTSLRLSAWVRVLTQTVPLAGIAGSECPIMFQITYKNLSPADVQKERTYCLYAYNESGVQVEDTGSIRYRALPPFQWYQLIVDLRDDEFIRTARYIQSLRIEARGHDYLSEITDVILVGRQ
jgi:hypothetical protein